MASFCYSCGAQVGDEDLFCQECGCRLKDEENISQTSSSANQPKAGNGTHAHGYILTNLKALSTKFNCSTDTVRHLLEQYIAHRQQDGIRYVLIDVADYSPKLSVNKGFFFSRIHLTPEDGWQKHQRLLMDRYFYDKEKKKDVEYLFIIGSDDVIPMPAVGTHSASRQTDPISSDLPYSHLYGDKTESLIDSYDIYQQPQMLYVGRLPLAGNATLDMLRTYLDNACELSAKGLDQGCIYGQCDPHWKKVTSFISNDLYENDWFPDYDGLTEEYAYRSLLLTPFITKDNVEQVFYPDASFYYFNMHGSDYPAQNDYSGAELLPDGKNGTFHSGITPKQFRSINSLNVVVAEPCYGAKPNKKRHDESILLSALTTKTALFFGSTHVAWGGVDPAPQASSLQDSPPCICCADIMAGDIIYGLLQGAPAGIALWQGRASNFMRDGITPHVIDTCLEFNLFGDPSLNIYGMSSEGKAFSKLVPHTKKASCPNDSPKAICPAECERMVKVTTMFSQESTSILSSVRNAVNQNMAEIQNKINRYLYQNYNIAPKQLNSVLRISYAHGKETYAYYYKDTDVDYVVTIDKKNQIKSVISSR